MLAPSRWRLISVVAALIFGVLFTLPNLLPASVREQLPAFLPKQTLNLGLDLQGGSYLKLSVDTRALRVEKTTNLIEDVRTTLRAEDIAFTDLGQVGSDVTVRITDPARSNEALNLLRTRLGGDIATGGSGLELSSQADQRIRMGWSAQALNAEASRAVDQSIEIIRRRIDALGTREPAIQRQGFDQIVVQAPGESDPERLKSIIGQTAKLTFQMVDDSVSVAEALQGRVPPGSVVLPSQDEGPLLLKKRAVVTGEMLTEASQGFDGQTGQPVVNFRFNGQGASRFGETTANNIGKR
ncbi:MAG: protein translocase subunit SecD, partial [Phenylobacterium sp.]|nr:protein translocase subunit SecD [Phenylobacterium sp.]